MRLTCDGLALALNLRAKLLIFNELRFSTYVDPRVGFDHAWVNVARLRPYRAKTTTYGVP